MTLLGWASLLVWVFGKKFAPLISLSMASILLGSTLLNIDLIGTTIRNIEYLAILGFIIFAGKLLAKKAGNGRRKLTYIFVGLIYSLTLAGDSFFFYTIFLSLLLGLCLFWLVRRRLGIESSRIRLSAGYVLLFSILAFFIRTAVSLLGIAHYYNNPAFATHLVSPHILKDSLATAGRQFLTLAGSLGGSRQGTVAILNVPNLVLVILGLAGLVLALVHVLPINKSRPKLQEDIGIARAFTVFVASLAFFVTFFAYGLSTLVLAQSGSGKFVSAYQERYLTMLPLLIVVGVVCLAWRLAPKQPRIIWWLPALMLTVLALGALPIKHAHVLDGSARDSQVEIARVAQKNHISLLITGYWYGAASRFWSHNQIDFASVAGCNAPSPPFNSRVSWYRPDASTHLSALVVDHAGFDQNYWMCSDSQLLAIYGTPYQKVNLGKGKPELWVYKYDLRTRIAPITF